MRRNAPNGEVPRPLRSFVSSWKSRGPILSGEIDKPHFPAKTPARAKPDGLTPVALRAKRPLIASSRPSASRLIIFWRRKVGRGRAHGCAPGASAPSFLQELRLCGSHFPRTLLSLDITAWKFEKWLCLSRACRAFCSRGRFGPLGLHALFSVLRSPGWR